jgi:phospholipase/carboxylesterase
MARLVGAFDPRFIVIAARSPIELGQNAYGWFHARFTPQGPQIDAAEAEAAWKHIASFIDELVAEYDADPARVFIAGFSQGGIMALATMLTAPEKLAGVACMSGRLLPEVLPHAAPPERLRDKPVLIVHGTRDERLGLDLRPEGARHPAPTPAEDRLPRVRHAAHDDGRERRLCIGLVDLTNRLSAPGNTRRKRWH